MKKIKLITLVAVMLGLVAVSSPNAYADGFAPGEGLYVGAFVSGAMGIVQPKVATIGTTADGTPVGGEQEGGGDAGGIFEVTDGGIGLAGVEGGGRLGYGYRMGDLYAGIEGEMETGDVKFKLTSSTQVTLSGSDADGNRKYITSMEASKDWTGGMFGRLGYYINQDTLVAFRGGVLVSKFDVETLGNTTHTENFYGGGPSFGASLESRVTAIDPNLSLRIGAAYTDFMTASVFGLGANKGSNDTATTGHDSEVTGSALSAQIGVQYSFFDVNSLF
jgi:hypothetical protein